MVLSLNPSEKTAGERRRKKLTKQTITHTHTHLMALVRDSSGEPVPER